jgi:hypothetical protein
MNQVMINAVELDSLLKEVEYLKHENQKLKEQLRDTQDRIRVLKEEVGFAERGYTKVSNAVTIDDIVQLLEVNKKSAVQRMSRLVKKRHAIKLNSPKRGVPSRFKLLVPVESLLKTQKFPGPKMNREINWKKFCSDPFRLTKEAAK